MSILVNENTRLLVQGITGREGSFHAKRCREYGANLVAGVTPGRGGMMFDETVPVYNTGGAGGGGDRRRCFAHLCAASLRRRRNRGVGRRRNTGYRLHHRGGPGDGHGPGCPLPKGQAGHSNWPQLPGDHLTRRQLQDGHNARPYPHARQDRRRVQERHPDLRGGRAAYRPWHRPVQPAWESAATR